jgi:hypothetical protein
MNFSFDKTNRFWVRPILAVSIMFLGLVSAFAGGGGGGSTGTNPLPQTAPAPDVLMRDSFGQGPELLRPASGNGTLKSTATGGTSFNGFWLEYPGNKNNRWITPDSGDTWRFCSTGPNPYELFSPLQVTFGFEGNQILCTLLNAPLVSATKPTALMPIPSSVSSVPYEIEIDGSYWFVATNAYIAVGLTNSAATTNNLSSSGNVVLVMRPIDTANSMILYEFRLGGFNGQLLASGFAEEDEFFNQMKIRYNPQTRSIGANFKGMDLGTFATNIAPPRYAAFEGVGYVDNFVVRALP